MTSDAPLLCTRDEMAVSRGPAEDAPAARPDTVRLAAWFHDAVYTASGPPGADEEASATLAEARLTGAGVDATTVAEMPRSG